MYSNLSEFKDVITILINGAYDLHENLHYTALNVSLQRQIGLGGFASIILGKMYVLLSIENYNGKNENEKNYKVQFYHACLTSIVA